MSYSQEKYSLAPVAYWSRWVLAVVCGAAIGILISGYQARDSAIAGCQRNSEFKALVASFLDNSARFRRDEGNLSASEESKEMANTARATIPYPSELAPGEKRGKLAEKRKEGCEDAYPPPIPFVE